MHPSFHYPLGIAVGLALLWAACEARPPAEAPPEPPWSPGMAVSTAQLDEVRGQRTYRGIIHAHSALSHDACDGHRRPEFTDAQCLQSLRDGMCKTHQDFVFLSDHPANMRDHPFEDALMYSPGDELVHAQGRAVANRLRCPEGHAVLVQAGFESTYLMPIALQGHITENVDERHALYGATDATSMQALLDGGGLLFLPHTESKNFEWYADLPFSGLEIYNLHANVDPKIRSEFLGLDDLDFFSRLLAFTTADPDGPHPDLSFLAFFSPNEPALAAWDRMLLRRRMAGIAGTDAHENVFVNKMRDGERGDSYRRMFSFFSNHIRVDNAPRGAIGIQALRESIVGLRHYVAFEALGIPAGFDFHVADARGVIAEMGAEVPMRAGLTLVVTPPRVFGRFQAGTEPPAIESVLYRLDGAGREEIARSPGEIRHAVGRAGVYRAEVWIVPHHLRGDLAGLAEALIRPYPWVYASPLFLVD
jgi:hypothetical protein